MRYLLLLAVLLMACNPIQPTNTSPQYSSAVEAQHKIVVAVIDGVRMSESRHLPLIFGELAPQGATLRNLWNEGHTVTRPGHATMLTGVYQWISNTPDEFPHQPTFFEYYRESTGAAASKAYYVAGKTRLQYTEYSDAAGYGIDYAGTFIGADTTDDVTHETALDILQTYHPDFMLINYGEVDERGHECVLEDYLASIDRADTLVYNLWNELQSMPYYAGDTYLFITSDHGRHTTDYCKHGDTCEGCRQLLGVVLGPGIAVGASNTYYEQTQFCRTFGWIMGVETPLAEGWMFTDIWGNVSGIE